MNSQGFSSLLETLRYGDGLCWIKLTGSYRISSHAQLLDVVPLAQAVIDAAQDRVIWGTDFPHLSFNERSSVELFNLLLHFAPDERTRNRILVDNPAMLFGF